MARRHPKHDGKRSSGGTWYTPEQMSAWKNTDEINNSQKKRGIPARQRVGTIFDCTNTNWMKG